MILGLDVSTSTVGWAIVKDDGCLVSMGNVCLSKYATLWDKADALESSLCDIQNDLLSSFELLITDVYIEESLLRFTPGQSSAATITTLSKFNALASYVARRVFVVEPAHVSAGTARKTCGMKIQRTSVCGKTGKQQAFDWCITGPLKDVSTSFPRTRTGKFKPFVFDRVDAYVVASAGCIMNREVSK